VRRREENVYLPTMNRALLAALLACSLASAQTRKIKAVILTGQHSYPQDAFFSVFNGTTDLEYTHVDMPDQSEAFEDISKWDYDVMIMHNSGQKISAKREQNLLTLLSRGVDIVVIHHAVCAYEDFPAYKQIVGCKFHGVAEVVDGVRYESNYKEPTDVHVIVDDKSHPLMAGFKDFTITDEVYTDMSYVADNHVLAHTDHSLLPGKPQVWTRRYSNANVFTITLGHRAATLTGPFMKTLIPNAIRWAVTSNPTAVLSPARIGRKLPILTAQAGRIFFSLPGSS